MRASQQPDAFRRARENAQEAIKKSFPLCAADAPPNIIRP